MAQHLTDTIVKKELEAPAKGNKITYDDDVKGFGCRVTAAGAKSFVLNYRTKSGRERRYTIGAFPAWLTKAARDEAKALKTRIDRGEDPVADDRAARQAPTVADMCARYIEEHLQKKRESSARDDRAMIDKIILPDMGSLKVAEVEYSNIDALHRRLTKRAPYRANRVHSLLSKMFALAIRWKMRTDNNNPAKGIERNPESKRKRYLKPEELARLTAALATFPDQEAANIVRLLLLTGARRGEVLAARWDQFDLKTGVWTKPAATTKQNTEHQVPLSAAARQLLDELYAGRAKSVVYVFPGRGVEYRMDLKKPWAAILKAANITGLRIHDLRHSYASMLVSGGQSLPVIGALLGHTQASTTQRYAHLMDDPLRKATETVGAIVSGKPVAEVHDINKRRA